MTLESWSMGIVRPVMADYPYAWAFFIPFILVATFTILNLFIAIIVNAMQTYSETEHQAPAPSATATDTTDLQRELSALREEMRELKSLLAAHQPSRQDRGAG
jgi:voltage-gated sodium channel